MVTAICVPSYRDNTGYYDHFFPKLYPEIKKAGAPYRLYMFEDSDIGRCGIVKARNRLFKLALADQDITHIVTLSNDILELPQNYLATLLDLLKKYPQAGAICPYQIINLNDGRGWGQVLPDGSSNWVPEGSSMLDFETYPAVEWSSAFSILPRSTFDTVGLLDEGYAKGGYEVQDYSARIWGEGLENLYTGAVKFKQEIRHGNNFPQDPEALAYHAKKWGGYLDVSNAEFIERVKAMRQFRVGVPHNPYWGYNPNA